MLQVRELAELAQRLDAAAFSRQMGPFALVRRPTPDSRPPASLESGTVSTNLNPVLKLKGHGATVDFGDLTVALLPPMGDGESELTIGRAIDCDVVVDDASVSRKHAVIRWSGEHGVLVELGSSNGTFINGHRMKERWTLRDGDNVAIGDSAFTYLLTPSLHARLRRLVHDR